VNDGVRRIWPSWIIPDTIDKYRVRNHLSLDLRGWYVVPANGVESIQVKESLSLAYQSISVMMVDSSLKCQKRNSTVWLTDHCQSRTRSGMDLVGYRLSVHLVNRRSIVPEIYSVIGCKQINQNTNSIMRMVPVGSYLIASIELVQKRMTRRDRALRHKCCAIHLVTMALE